MEKNESLGLRGCTLTQTRAHTHASPGSCIPEWEEKKLMALSQIVIKNHHLFQSTIAGSILKCETKRGGVTLWNRMTLCVFTAWRKLICVVFSAERNRSTRHLDGLIDF